MKIIFLNFLILDQKDEFPDALTQEELLDEKKSKRKIRICKFESR